MATNVFLSYATRDHYFAELTAIKLAEAEIRLWRDRDQLRPGTDWRNGIERGIADSLAVLVALSAESVASPYVTYEWAYALGKGKPIIPLRLGECKVHPKLETIQHLDFSVAGALPWKPLIERIREIEPDQETARREAAGNEKRQADTPPDARTEAILAYLDRRGYQMVSLERLREQVDPAITDEEFRELLARNPGIFRPTILKGGKSGLAKLIP